MLDFESATPAELAQFVGADRGFGFRISIPIRWTCSEEALTQQSIPYMPDVKVNDRAARAIHYPQRMTVTAERLAEMYRITGYHAAFTFEFTDADDAGIMFDAIFYFLVHFNERQGNTARRPNGDVTTKVIALDKLARLLWVAVGWQRIVLEGWRWDEKMRLGKFDKPENLSSLVTLGLAPRMGVQAESETVETSDNEALEYRSPIERFIARTQPQARSGSVNTTRQRETFGSAAEDNGNVAINNIPDWMLKGIS